jgi:hypothetical protein
MTYLPIYLNLITYLISLRNLRSDAYQFYAYLLIDLNANILSNLS